MNNEKEIHARLRDFQRLVEHYGWWGFWGVILGWEGMMTKLLVVATVAFLALLTLRVSHLVPLSWALIAAPLWIYAALAIVVIVLFYALKIEHYGRE